MEETYTKDTGEVIYQIIDKEDDFPNLAGWENESVCFIDRIDADEQGKGYGTQLMMDFISYVKKTYGVSKFYLYAVFDPFMFYEENDDGSFEGYDEDDTESNIGRLVEFYKRLGFSDLAGYSSNESYVDMSLDTEKIEKQ